MRDVAVVGSGPAGIAVASACAARGLEVVCVAPAPRAPWPNNYGAWQDELPSAFADAYGARWSKARVRFDAEDTKAFDRAYVRLDNPTLRARLEAAGRFELVDARVRGVEHLADRSALALEGGQALEARVVVDASGRGALVEAPDVEAWPAAQVAYGVELEARHGLDLDEFLFMDFSPVPEDGDDLPTFLYAMPLGSDRVFVEETVLVGRPPASFERLERRLGARLEALGLDLRAARGPVERCFIPMGRPIPRGPQRVVPFGASAGMVHPASGYLLTRVLGGAPDLADALARGLEADPGRPALAAELGWQAVWPPGRRRLWEVYRFGMEVLLALDAPGTRGFFRSFFEVDPAVWARYLSGEAEGRHIAQAMLSVFGRVPWRVRQKIVRTSVGGPGFELLARLS